MHGLFQLGSCLLSCACLVLLATPCRAGNTGNAGPAPQTEKVESPAVKGVSPDLLKTSDSEPKIIFKPGQPVSVDMHAEDICVTDDVQVAREQVAAFPDSPDASFILAVALTRTSMIEQALSEVRRARRLAEKQGGPAYFDKMIGAYEDMLKEYPNDNRLRYGLAWAYYMKAYVLAKYSKDPQAVPAQTSAQASTQTNTKTIAEASTDQKSLVVAPSSKSEVDQNPSAAQSQPAQPAGTIANDWRSSWVSALGAVVPQVNPSGGTNNPSNPKGFPAIKGALEQAPPGVADQVRSYYQSALKNLDDLLQRNPNDVWARVYRAFVYAEFSSDLQSAMTVWRSCQTQFPDNPAPYFFLGEGYLKEGNLQECLQNISRAVALRAVGK
jgi:tetratricopeptide (TPR) repeat protein